MPSNFIEKYLDKSRRTKVVLSVPRPHRVPRSPSSFVINLAISYLSTYRNLSPQPRRDRTVLKRNIAFSSSRKENPFLPLEHSLEIDSAYIGLPVASQTVGRHSLPRRNERVFLRSRSVCRLLLSCTDACCCETSTGKVHALLILMMRLDVALSAKIKTIVANEIFVPRETFVWDLMF